MRWFRKSPGTNRSGANPIHEWLDHFAVPWRDTRQDLITRFGVTQHTDGSTQAIELSLARPPLPALVRPMYITQFDNLSPFVPATEFIAETYYSADERQNIKRTADYLSKYLGNTPIEQHLNTLRAIWKFDRAEVRLLVWPSDMQHRTFFNNVNRERKLQLACYITINTGFLIEPSSTESAWLQSFVELAALTPFSKPWGENRPTDYELEYVRDDSAITDINGKIGLVGGGVAIAFQLTNLYLIRISSICKISVERTLPAKGPGGSELQIICGHDTDEQSTKAITVCVSGKADDLNDLGKTIAEACGVKVELSPYYHDC